MSIRVTLALVALAGVAVGCTATTNAPATTPTIPGTTSTIIPGSVITTTSTTMLTTTTVDRVAEITAIFEDLERRRLQAILDQDEEAFRALFANDEYLEGSLVALKLVTVLNPELATVVVVEVFADESACIAVDAEFDLTGATQPGSRNRNEHVIEMRDGLWGFSWAGKGWRCDGPNPLS